MCIAKPALITGGQRGIFRSMVGTAMWLTGVVQTIDLKETSAAMLHHALHGFEGLDGILLNSEMITTGKEVLNNKKE